MSESLQVPLVSKGGVDMISVVLQWDISSGFCSPCRGLLIAAKSSCPESGEADVVPDMYYVQS